MSLSCSRPTAAIPSRESTKPVAESRFHSPSTKRPDLFIAVAVCWLSALAWFHPRLWSLMDLADGWLAKFSVGYFVIFAELAWLYGIYNVAIVCFAAIYRRTHRHRYLSTSEAAATRTPTTPVAVLYTTCNDFVEESARSCVDLEYANFTIYLLDDSSDPEYRARVDRFAALYQDRVRVIRRADRRGFKAGNLNHALAEIANEPLFAIVDADEVVPRDFLSRLVPRIEADPNCGFVQANHRANPTTPSRLAQAMGIGIDIHWKWYQPLRNRYGFVMFLGHGALLKRECWSAVGGFPEIVSEDLGFAIAARESGYHGFFAEDLVCQEEFPETIRAFRVRHVKWTRGTCEFLWHWTGRLLRAKQISWAEKADILFPTLNLPMTFFFFIFLLNAQFLFPTVLGEVSTRSLSLVALDFELLIPTLTMTTEAMGIFGNDFYFITLVTVLAPVLCFILELWRRPRQLVRFLAHSAALYSALSPLTFIAVCGFTITRRAQFLVTGDANDQTAAKSSATNTRRENPIWHYMGSTHPDHIFTRSFEVFAGAWFALTAIATVQVAFLGIAVAYLMLPWMHQVGWSDPWVARLRWIPFSLVLLGLALGGLATAGLQPIFFGFGFHF